MTRLIPIRAALLLCVCVGVLPPCAGCVTIQPARALLGGASVSAPPRPESPIEAREGTNDRPDDRSDDQPDGGRVDGPGPGASAWPARWGDAGRTGAIVPSPHGPGDLRPAHLGRFHMLRVSDLEYTHAQALADAVGKDEGFRFEPEGPGSLVFLPPMGVPEDAGGRPDPDDAAETFVFVTGDPIERAAGDSDEHIALQRTWIACYDAHPSAERAEGTILLVPGMLGTPQPIIEGMIRYWRRAGFSVIRLLSHPSRFTERVEIGIAEGEEAEAGRLMADLFDDRTAENTYAVHAGIDRWFDRRPGLAGKPLVYVGMSGGAIVGPAALTYRPGRFDAAVLIAGGVDFFSISTTSNYAEWIDAIAIDWEPEDPDSEGEPTPERMALISDAYLAASQLDAMHRAPLVGVPTLVLHAAKDRAVPSRLGDTLWNRLGQPERWVFPVGHELIFVMLPTQADRMDAWIKRTLARTDEQSTP